MQKRYKWIILFIFYLSLNLLVRPVSIIKISEFRVLPVKEQAHLAHRLMALLGDNRLDATRQLEKNQNKDVLLL